MKRNRRKTAFAAQSGSYAMIILVALVLPLSINMALSGVDVIAGIGEKAAVFASVISMPDVGLDMLREKFRAELYEEPPEQGEELPQHSPRLPSSPLPENQPSQSPETTDLPPSNPLRILPEIPLSYRGEILTENFAGTPGGTLIRVGAGYLRNDTDHQNERIVEWLQASMPLSFEDTLEPQVLIYHTHATESFERYDTPYYDTRNTWRSTDNNNNMAAVGAAMVQELERAGIGVIHDTTQHDFPSYNGSYERSAETISGYLEQYPGIKVVLDLHRDAMERENHTIVKPVAVIDGKKAAQIMLIAGCDNGKMGMESWRENMRFAAAFQDAMEQDYPELTRPILLSYRKYNQHLSTGALLMEFGSNANTLEEAVYAAQLAGRSLARLINGNISI